MAKKLYEESSIQGIANAIRAKNGSSDTYTVGDMATAIQNIPTGGGDITGDCVVNANHQLTGYGIEVIVPSGVTDIGNRAFYNCKSLTSVTIPSSVTSIGDGAFSSCTSLTSVTIPSSVTSIGQQVFQSCKSLTSIDIPSGVTNIGQQAFNGCSFLVSITCRNTTPPTIQSNTFLNVPATCAIYVPAESVEVYKTAQYWSARADYIQAIPS